MKIEIKSWLSGSVLFEGDFSCIAEAVRAAVKGSASLSYADLSHASLSYADLSYADLRFADLSYADLSHASLSYADLSYASLSYADLRYASLSYADLRYAHLRSANLRYADLRYADLSYADLRSADLSYGKINASPRPFFQISPLGADARQLMAFDTDKGIFLVTGCFSGSVAEFKSALKGKHGKNDTAKEYLLALNLILNHFKIWSK